MIITQGYSLMVEQRSSKSYAWVRILLSLLVENKIVFFKKKKKLNYENKTKLKKFEKFFKKKKPSPSSYLISSLIRTSENSLNLNFYKNTLI